MYFRVKCLFEVIVHSAMGYKLWNRKKKTLDVMRATCPCRVGRHDVALAIGISLSVDSNTCAEGSGVGDSLGESECAKEGALEGKSVGASVG